ncbi:MAG: hypothetical protein ACRCY1_06685 [Leuconostoc suionicum]|uniref:hypothetical protein n=1 Tax=Leuconostoc suionicum TaxID=1511761 RepID=UPI003F3C05ED
MKLLFIFTLLFWLFLGLYSSEKRKNKQARLKVQPKAYVYLGLAILMTFVGIIFH